MNIINIKFLKYNNLNEINDFSIKNFQLKRYQTKKPLYIIKKIKFLMIYTNLMISIQNRLIS